MKAILTPCLTCSCGLMNVLAWTSPPSTIVCTRSPQTAWSSRQLPTLPKLLASTRHRSTFGMTLDRCSSRPNQTTSTILKKEFLIRTWESWLTGCTSRGTSRFVKSTGSTKTIHLKVICIPCRRSHSWSPERHNLNPKSNRCRWLVRLNRAFRSSSRSDLLSAKVSSCSTKSKGCFPTSRVKKPTNCQSI